MLNKGLDWRALLTQQPQGSSVAKRNRPPTGEQTPKTPPDTADTSSFSRAVLPFLFLKTPAPSKLDQEAKPPSHQPYESLLTKLSEAREKAASLIAKSTHQPLLSTPAAAPLAANQLLQDPLPAPEHVQQSSSCWYDQGQPSSSQQQATSRAANTHSKFAASSRAQGGTLVQSSSTQGPTQQQLHGGACSMHTSMTGATAGTSLVSTAHSPGQQWQNALVRLRQLQQQTQEAFAER